MNILIKGYHGMTPVLQKKIESIGATPSPDENSSWLFKGTFDEFFNKWQNIFMYYPVVGQSYDGLIFVTHKNGFYSC
jgi:hypothetical protein